MVTYANALTAITFGLAVALPSAAWAQAIPQQEPPAANAARIPGQEAIPPVLPPASIAQTGGCPVGSSIGADPSMWTDKQRALVDLWDANNDGKISVAEQTACLNQVGTANAGNQLAPLPDVKPNTPGG